MRIFITGHKGFIGRHLNQRLLDQGHEVMGADLKDGLDVADITNLDSFRGTSRIVHLAAHTKYPKKNTIDSCHGILDFYKSLSPRSKFIYASSAAVYGVPVGAPTLYGVHKLYGERLFESELECDELTILRLFNVYGGDGNGLIDRIGRKEHIKINGSGEQRRDYVHINDVVSAFVAALEHEIFGTFDIGTGVSVSVNQVLDLAGYNDYEHVLGHGGVSNSIADTNYSFPWQAKHSLVGHFHEEA